MSKYLSTATWSLALAMAMFSSYRADDQPVDDCLCPIDSLYLPSGNAIPACVQSFGISIDNGVSGRCSIPSCEGEARICTANVTVSAYSDHRDPCEWEAVGSFNIPSYPPPVPNVGLLATLRHLSQQSPCKNM